MNVPKHLQEGYAEESQTLKRFRELLTAKKKRWHRMGLKAREEWQITYIDTVLACQKEGLLVKAREIAYEIFPEQMKEFEEDGAS